MYNRIFFIIYKTACVSDQNAHKTLLYEVDNQLHLPEKW